MIVARLWCNWTLIQVGWRFGQELDGTLLLIGPKAGYPLPATGDLVPVTGHPSLLRRCIAIDTTDPQIFLLFIIPGPIAGNPEDVFAVGF